jgi:hypothetical protein
MMQALRDEALQRLKGHALPKPHARAASPDRARRAADRLRAYQESNMGNYECIFPSTDPEKQAIFERCLAAAKVNFKQHHSKRLRDHLDCLAAQHTRLRGDVRA